VCGHPHLHRMPPQQGLSLLQEALQHGPLQVVKVHGICRDKSVRARVGGDACMSCCVGSAYCCCVLCEQLQHP
jgi:hypothetical protein